MIPRIHKTEQQPLKEYSFKKTLYQNSDIELRERNRQIYFALVMGKELKKKAKVVFNTLDGYQIIFASVWAATEKFILLNDENFIPLDAIAYVEVDDDL